MCAPRVRIASSTPRILQHIQVGTDVLFPEEKPAKYNSGILPSPQPDLESSMIATSKLVEYQLITAITNSTKPNLPSTDVLYCCDRKNRSGILRITTRRLEREVKSPRLTRQSKRRLTPTYLPTKQARGTEEEDEDLLRA
jgi:hypothetical protein